MQVNYLKLKGDKSDIIIIGPKFFTQTIHFCLTINNSTPSAHIYNLEAISAATSPLNIMSVISLELLIST